MLEKQFRNYYLEASRHSGVTGEALLRTLELRLEAFNRMIRQHVERELERRAYRQGEKLTREVLSEELGLMPEALARLETDGVIACAKQRSAT